MGDAGHRVGRAATSGPLPPEAWLLIEVGGAGKLRVQEQGMLTGTVGCGGVPQAAPQLAPDTRDPWWGLGGKGR